MDKSDLNRNLVAALAYFLGFITGIVILLVEKEDKFIRFHAMQSTIVSGSFFVINLVIGIAFGNLTFLSFLAVIFNALIWVLILVVWIVSMIRAYGGQMFKWPIAGDLAEKQVG